MGGCVVQVWFKPEADIRGGQGAFELIETDAHGLVLVDTAGLRRKSKVDEAVEKFSIVKTLQAIEQCQVAVLMPTWRQMSLTGTPASLNWTRFSSRSSFMARAILSSASSQVIGSILSAPGRRIMGWVSRVSDFTKSFSAEPFGHSVPRLVGWSTSPSIWIRSAWP